MKAIEVVGLTKYYGSFLAVDNVSFEVRKGEIFGFLGPNGAGKTTTVRTITGILRPNSGEIRVLGYDMLDEREKIRARERTGIVPEMANPYVDLTAMQNLRLMGELYGMGRREIERRSVELLKLFDLYEKRNVKVKAFSKGMKQRLILAMAMISDPELLILDEPTSGLDVLSARLIKDVIREEKRKGKTIFMTTHNMVDANELCERIGIIRKGRLIAIDTPEKLKQLVKGSVSVEVSFEPMKLDPSEIASATRVELMGDKARVFTNDPDATVKELVHYAERNNLRIVSLKTLSPSLEDVFIKLVGEGND
ncbi:daunorubicin resistance protein DrrA family ABC transporter ATP-binding protein [Thermococcus gammatolerans]|uniref:ABC-type transport system, ATPase component, putative multidrug/lipooligosaccharide transporter n=1 Tax=Thermococcus gammatolerans (strain DSM 15229 / JCM 11827 / EJ3) TaxID=593117 RepID=C5A527_THEGJ|nr:daunorubicin resistance protein DrrA family ABC transporter ATP-binding protein [Thermococcus gammatolerans]ACS33339.1 ABC-type transport system, ATPase component, putative multidrug/lipooligosaccharide transporter [Thermococcus gammatolerans EJ3]